MEEKMEEFYIKKARDIIMSHMDVNDLGNFIEVEKEIRKYKLRINKIKRKLAKKGKLEQVCLKVEDLVIEDIQNFCEHYKVIYRNLGKNSANLRMIGTILEYYETKLQYWEDFLIEVIQEQREKEIVELE